MKRCRLVRILCLAMLRFCHLGMIEREHTAFR